MSFRKIVVPPEGFESFTKSQADIKHMKNVDNKMRHVLSNEAIPEEIKLAMYSKMVHLFSQLLNDFRNPVHTHATLEKEDNEDKEKKVVVKKPVAVKYQKTKKIRRVKKHKVVPDETFFTPASDNSTQNVREVENETPKKKKENKEARRTRYGRIVKTPNRFGSGKPFRVRLYKFT